MQRFQYIVYGSTAPADLTIKFGKKISYGREKLILFGLGDGNTSNAFFGIREAVGPQNTRKSERIFDHETHERHGRGEEKFTTNHTKDTKKMKKLLTTEHTEEIKKYLKRFKNF